MPSRAHRNVIGVGGILEYGDGIVLVRLNYSRHKGLFMFPGGKVEPGETLQGALVREVEEETGLVATPRRVVAVRHRVDQGELNTYLVFAMRYVRGELRSDGCENDVVGVFGADDFRAAPDRFVGVVPAVATRILEGNPAGLGLSTYVPKDDSSSPKNNFELFSIPTLD